MVISTMASSDFSPGFPPDFTSSAYTSGYDGCGPPTGWDLPCSVAYFVRCNASPTSRSPYAGGSFTAAFQALHRFPGLHFAWLARLPLVPVAGLTFRRCRTMPASPFTLCYGLLFCSPSSGGYSASAQPVAREHWEPAMWLPAYWQVGSYHGWTLTN